MKISIKQYLSFLMLVLMNSVAFAHVSAEHNFNMTNGLLHIFLEPSYLTIALFVVFTLVLILRNYVLKITDWFIKSVHKS